MTRQGVRDLNHLAPKKKAAAPAAVERVVPTEAAPVAPVAPTAEPAPAPSIEK